MVFINECCLNAWRAGFVDGEGCITISKQVRKNRPTDQFRVSITIANTNQDCLLLFHSKYGGTIRFNKEKRFSKSGARWSDSWTWYCKMSSTEEFLKDILPYLIIKKRNAEIALQFIDVVKNTVRMKGGRNKDGTFKGSSQLSDADLKIRNDLKDEIQALNSRVRIKKIADDLSKTPMLKAGIEFKLQKA